MGYPAIRFGLRFSGLGSAATSLFPYSSPMRSKPPATRAPHAPSKVFVAILLAMLTASPTLAASAHEHDHPASPGIESSEPVWITLGQDVFDALRRTPGVLARTMQPKTQGTANGVVMTLVDPRDLDALSAFIHDKVNRCPGFIVHDDREDAVAALLTAGRLAAKHGLPVVLEIDQQATVGALLPMLVEANVLATISHLSTAYVNRYYQNPTGTASAQWIRDLWAGYAGARLGVDVTVELYAHSGYPQPSVILTLTGSTRPDQIVVLGGHLDSIRSGGTGTTTSAPGADDNASGIAALSEALRVLMVSGHVPERTIKFIGYAAEEVGLRGSADIAEDHAAAGAVVVGVMQLDMTAYNGSVEDVALIDDFTNPDLSDFVAELLDTYQPDVTWTTSTCGYACSDHASWHREGFPTVMPHEARASQNNPTIHGASDNLATIGNTAAHALKFTKLGLTFAIEAGSGGGGTPPAPPAQPLLVNSVSEVISASTGTELFYMIDVPAGATNLSFTTTGTNGDADLYVSFGCLPSQGHADCSSTSSSSNESCVIAPAREGLYYVLVHAWSGFSNVSLRASFTPPPSPVIFDDGFESGDTSAWSATVP